MCYNVLLYRQVVNYKCCALLVQVGAGVHRPLQCRTTNATHYWYNSYWVQNILGVQQYNVILELIQCNTLHTMETQYAKTQNNTLQCNAKQWIQYNAIQCNTMQRRGRVHSGRCRSVKWCRQSNRGEENRGRYPKLWPQCKIQIRIEAQIPMKNTNTNTNSKTCGKQRTLSNFG